MKRYFMLRIPALLFFCLSILNSNAQMGIGTTTPDSSSVLDVYSSNKGLLIPRVALTATNVAAPVNNPATSLMVYNTATAGTAPNNVVPGFYYWANNRWNPVMNRSANAGDMQYWDSTKWVAIPAGSQGQVLTWCNGKPQWGPCVSQNVTVAPANNPYEGYISSYAPNSNGFIQTNQFPIETWTVNGNPYSDRALICFDYSNVPNGAVIDSAKFYLYATPTPLNGNLTDPHFGTANSFLIQRITSTWTLPTPFTWNNPPLATTTNQVVVPQSTSSFQTSIIDVTQLVKDQLSFGNNGFLMRLAVEQIYNSRQYATSRSGDPTKYPKLIIYYH